VGTTGINNNEYLDMLSGYGFRLFKCINAYTRIHIGCSHSYHTLVKYNNNVNNIIEAGIIQTNISDHYFIILSIDIFSKLLHT
jgi:hypothetical protein